DARRPAARSPGSDTAGSDRCRATHRRSVALAGSESAGTGAVHLEWELYRSTPMPASVAAPEDCWALSLWVATGSLLPDPASTAFPGTPCPAMRRWPVSTAKLHTVSSKAAAGSIADWHRSTSG